MKIKLDDGKEYEATAHSVAYSNDILNGVLLDMESNYAFLSDHIEAHRDAIEQIPEMAFYDLSELDINLSEAPHCWIVQSVGKLIIRCAESLLD